MYSFIDQSPDRLVAGSRFILWGMRGWVMSAMQNRCPLVTLTPSFSRMGMAERLGDFHELMLGFHRDGLCRMAFGALNAPHVTEIEAVMLALWSDVAANRSDRARAVLALIVIEGQIDELMARMARMVAHMSALQLAPVGLESSAFPASSNARPA